MNQQNHPSVHDIETALGLNVSRRKRWLKRLPWLAVVAALLLGGFWLYASRQQAATTIAYETAPARLADLTITVAATGTIEPLTQVDIGSEASGVVRAVLVGENDVVKAGDTLAVLDTVRLDAQRAKTAALVQAAEARLLQAEATLAETRQVENRLKALRQKGLSSAQDMDTANATLKRAEAALSAAQADVMAAKAELAVIDADIAKTRIVSPINGIVLKRSVEPGQTVAASLQAPVLFQIAQDLTRIQLEAAIDEADMGTVAVGQQATFTVDAYDGRDFPARIERLSFAPETVDGVVTYKAILSAANVDLSLRPGMTATARIVVREFKQALVVPNEALRFQPPRVPESQGFSITRMFMPRFPQSQRGGRAVAADGTRAVHLLQNGAPVERRIKTGASDGQFTIVLEGDVKADDPLVISQRGKAR
jgi:HlyD family secretion protein